MHSAAEHCPTPTRSGRSRVESGRSRAESGRSRAESGRSRAESGRSSVERGRSSAESGRGKVESDTAASPDALRPLTALLRPLLKLPQSAAAVGSVGTAVERGAPNCGAFRFTAAALHTMHYCGRFPLYCGRSLSVSDSVPQRNALMGHHTDDGLETARRRCKTFPLYRISLQNMIIDCARLVSAITRPHQLHCDDMHMFARL